MVQKKIYSETQVMGHIQIYSQTHSVVQKTLYDTVGSSKNTKQDPFIQCLVYQFRGSKCETMSPVERDTFCLLSS
jgi:hypothetical protein